MSNNDALREFKPDPLEQIIDNYIAEYEFNDGESFHAPSEAERFMIKDAIMGLISDPAFDEEWGKAIDEQAERKAAALAASKPEPQAQAGEPEVVSMADFMRVAQGAAEAERRSLEVITRLQAEAAEQRQAIAKQAAALQACVEALQTCQMVEGVTGWEYLYDIQKVADAITQAERALK